MALKPGGFIPVVHAATRQRPDEIDTLLSAEAVAHALGELGFATEIVAVDLDLNHFLALKRRDPLLVFNLVDAVRGDGRLAPVIPSMLDAVGLPFTGAHSDAWLETLSKVATKLKLAREGLPTPGFSVDGARLDPDAKVIVKAVWEHGSLGLDEGSVVKGADAARVIADRVARFGTEHFAERFVEGREFNLSLLRSVAAPACCRSPRSCSRIGARGSRASWAMMPNGRATARPMSARHAASASRLPNPHSRPSW